jgi:sugar (pentulose or hexulose) kinase
LWEGTSAAASGTADGTPREVHFDLPMPVGPGSEGVLVLPWHAGTRPPAVGVPSGQGCVLSLGLGHSGAHIVSAAVEAVCFQLAEGLDDLETMSEGQLQMVANGGAIERTPWWRGRLASTLGRAVRFPSAPETTARGAAALALGVELSNLEADGEVVAPADADVAALAHARSRWATCYESMLPIVGRLAVDR